MYLMISDISMWNHTCTACAFVRALNDGDPLLGRRSFGFSLLMLGQMCTGLHVGRLFVVRILNE